MDWGGPNEWVTRVEGCEWVSLWALGDGDVYYGWHGPTRDTPWCDALDLMPESRTVAASMRSPNGLLIRHLGDTWNFLRPATWVLRKKNV